ncbi:hypothetical protein, partial [Klebsiella pneumoniae]|uniref:hypothetical protein n=1 Tax=Klebsiella pneumoniae TaxID=573 RepID=UPI00405590B6
MGFSTSEGIIRDKKAARKIDQIADNDSQAPQFVSTDVPRPKNKKKNIHCSQIAGPSHRQVPFVRKNPIHDSQIAGPSTKEVPRIVS